MPVCEGRRGVGGGRVRQAIHGMSGGMGRWLVTVVAVVLRGLVVASVANPGSGTEWRQWRTEQGLPENAVECVYQARDGWIWVGTRRGVARFDGMQFARFNAQERGFTDDACIALGEDAAGGVYVGTKRGLFSFARGGFRPVPMDGENVPFQVRAIFGCKDGGLGVVTSGGVSVLKGGHWVNHRFVAERPDGDVGGPGPQVFGAAEASDGGIWVASDAGLFSQKTPDAPWIRHWQGGMPEKGSSSEGHIVRAALVGRDGEVWFATDQAVMRLNPGGLLVAMKVPPGIGDARLRRLLWDGDSVIAVAGGRIYRTEGGVLKAVGYRPEQDDAFVTDFIRDQDGGVWLGARYGGLIQVRTLPVRAFTTRDGLPHNNVFSVCASKSGGVWVATGAGVAEFAGDGFRLSELLPELGGKPTQAIFEDHAGDLWIGGAPTGVSWLTEATNNPARNATPGQTHVDAILPHSGGEADAFSVRHSSVRAFMEDRSGRLWVGCRSGLFAASSDAALVRARSGEIASGPVLASRRCWRWYLGKGGFGESDWMKVVEGGDRSLSSYYGLWDDRRNEWASDPTESMAQPPLPRGFELPSPEVRAMLHTRDGAYWFGTTAGLVRSDTSGLRVYSARDGLPGDTVDALLEANDGDVWVGSRNGLAFLHKNRWWRVGIEEGLGESAVNQILQDRDGAIWIGGRRGITRILHNDVDAYIRGELKGFQTLTLDEADGMLTAETMGGSQPSGAVTSDGRLWFATSQGVVMVDPTRLRGHRHGPRTAILSFRTGDNRTRVEAGMGGEQSSAFVALPRGSGRSLEVHYTAIDHSNPERLRFEYSLEGHDERPVAAENRRVAYFTNLRPGRYRFRVRAASHGGAWAEDWTAAGFVIEPYCWETLWFRGVVGLSVCGLGACMVVRRLREQRRIAGIERENRVRTERERIARDLHDDVAANLTLITMLSPSGSDPGSTGGDAALKRAADLADAALDNLGELVWATNPRFDSLADLAAYLRELTRRLLEGTGVEAQCDFDPEFPAYSLTGDFRRQCVLMLKESLHNVIKHAQARTVRVSFKCSPNDTESPSELFGTGSHQAWVLLTVEDDGVGLSNLGDSAGGVGLCVPNTPGGSGNGWVNLTTRARDLGGQMSVHGRPGQGTRMVFKLPIPHAPG